ncbi:MAG: hypothetical protein NTY77_07690 [Elusimicrobia bacterium]|nr:hypothetical protein [Elusimicrobiota bacterium]
MRGALKYIQAKILNTAQTAAVDFGVLSPSYLDKRLDLALTVTNLGGTLKHDQSAENLPLTFKAGAAFKLTQRWLASLDLSLPRGDEAYTAVGTEYVFPVKESWSVAGRLGFDSRTMGDVTGVSGISVGAGFASKALSLDYAFVPYGGLGITNRFSVSARF